MADRLSDAIAEHQGAIRLPLACRIEVEPVENSPEPECCNRVFTVLQLFVVGPRSVIV